MELHLKKLNHTATLPTYANPNDAGMDIYCSESTTVPPHSRTLIPTGIAMAIPENYVGLIWDKSGISSKHGLTTLAGVIDSSYRGEIKIVIHNLTNQHYQFETGKKVAQMLIQPIHQPKLIEVKELNQTQRNTGGFGSTGN